MRLHPGAAIGQQGREQTHGVGAAGIAHGFNVGVFVDVDAAADRNALRQILAARRHARSDQRFRIGAHVFAQTPANRRQRSFFFKPKEQFHGAE